MKFNINHTVKVKLTSEGIKILYEEHEKLREQGFAVSNFTAPSTDENGYTEYQLWVLMATFGPHIYMGKLQQPFETNIIIGEEND